MLIPCTNQQRRLSYYYYYTTQAGCWPWHHPPPPPGNGRLVQRIAGIDSQFVNGYVNGHFVVDLAIRWPKAKNGAKIGISPTVARVHLGCSSEAHVQNRPLPREPQMHQWA